MSIIAPQPKFKLNHSYVVFTEDRTALHITILRITQKCYEFQIKGANTTSWAPFTGVDTSLDIIEDLGIDKVN